MNQIFGRDHFVYQVTYERSGSAGIGQGGAMVDTGEYILLYRKGTLSVETAQSFSDLEESVMKRYRKILRDPGTRVKIDEFKAKSNNELVKVYQHSDYSIESISLRSFQRREEEIRQQYLENFNLIFRTTNPQKENTFQNELISQMDKSILYSVDYIPSRGKYKDCEVTFYYFNAELFAWLKDSAAIRDHRVVKENKLTTVWTHADIPKADLANEGGVDFRRGKKPEQLLRRILEFSTRQGDWVLDSFAGSGTTAAVAHKMRRKWITIELEDQCHTHVIPRLRSVIDGTDRSGISNSVDWEGGGGFRYYTLAPSLLEKDRFGNLIISGKYNPTMLSEAMCKLMNFTYDPSDTVYWQQGYSTERDFIYVTTQTLSRDQLAHLSDEVGEDRSLLVCCGAFRVRPDAFPNLTIKKIPKAVLNRCEWGKDDYSLEIRDLPPAPPAESDEDVQVETKASRRKKFAEDSEPSLFDFMEETSK